MTTKRLVTVTGLVAGGNGLTLFFANGMPEIFPADSYRTQDIIERVMPALAKTGKAEIDLGEYAVEKVLETLSGGKIANGQVAVGDKKIDAAPITKLAERTLAAGGSAAAKGLKNFMANFNQVKHAHRVEDLLAFIDKGDLPIADDGNIIAYKRLKLDHAGVHKATLGERYFVDIHSHSVPQRVGSIVEIPREKVDGNRNHHCSAGLHIAQRSYLRQFGGDVLVVVKIRPQDVIAVPMDTRDKVRVCRYQIVAEVPANLVNEINNRNPLLEDGAGRKLLSEIIAGHHAAATEIIDHDGTKSVVKPLKEARVAKKTKVRELKAAVEPKIDVKKIKAKAKEAAGPAKPAPKAKSAKMRPVKPNWKPEYIKQLDEAERLFTDKKNPLSLREIAKKLGMDRESMSNNLRFRGVL